MLNRIEKRETKRQDEIGESSASCILFSINYFTMQMFKHKISRNAQDANVQFCKLLRVFEPRQANLCLRAFRHDKF